MTVIYVHTYIYNYHLNIIFRQTPLHLAVLNNHEGSVTAIIDHKRLVEKGDLAATDRSNVSLLPNLNLKNSEGDTPVSFALTEGKELFFSFNILINDALNIYTKNLFCRS